MGYDDQEGLADQLTPALTTVSIPHYVMGRTGVQYLLGRLAGVSGPRAEPNVLKVPGQLIRRDSIGPPPAA